MCASRILILARTMRWATVDGAVRKARAISSVVRPQTSRNVSAIGASGGRAGWQQADLRPEDAARVGAVDCVHQLTHPRLVGRVLAHGYCWLNTMIGRTSTLPKRADGIFAATWRASFRSRALMR